MIRCQQVEKYHGAEQVLIDITFECNIGVKAGIVGQNGAGKSTLLRLLAGLERPDGGTIAMPKGTRVGYLTQSHTVSAEATVYGVLQSAFADQWRIQERLRELELEMNELSNAAGADADRMPQLLQTYAALTEQFEYAGGYELEARIQQVANGIGIAAQAYAQPFSALSGGEKTKVMLAKLLLERPDLLLLDEPTNHLDLPAITWLEEYVLQYAGTCLIASHDRYFLDRVVTQVIELEDGEAVTYATNYTDYQQEKQQRLLKQFADYKDQQKQMKQMKDAIRRYIEWGNIGAGNEKFFKRAANIQKALDRMEKIKRPVLERKKVDFQSQAVERSGKEVIICRELTKQIGDKMLFREVNLDVLYRNRVVMIGGNGAGKSTLLRMLLGSMEPDAGMIKLGSNVQLGYLAQEESPKMNQTVLAYYRDQIAVEEGEARSMLAKFLFYGSDVFKSVLQLSGGEWTRLKLAIVMQHRPNLLLLDEPTNHLDIPSREALEELLSDYEGTIVAISHDRYFINRIADQVWSLADQRVARYVGNFDEYKEQVDKQLLAAAQAVSNNRTAAPPSVNRSKRDDSLSRMKKLEQQIAMKEKEQCELEAEISNEAYGSDVETLTRLHQAQEACQQALELLYDQWLELEIERKGSGS